MNEEKTQNVREQGFESEYEKRLRQIYESGEATPTVALAYITNKITKGEIEAYTFDGQQHVAPKKSLWRVTDGVPQKPISTGYPREQHGGIISGVDVEYYRQMLLRIRREHKVTVHPRTREVIGSSTEDSRPQPYHKVERQIFLQKYTIVDGKMQPTGVWEAHPYGHLGGFPAVAYHQRTNAVQKSGKFVVKPRESTERCNPTDIQKLDYELRGELKYQNTAQYRSVWYTHGQRRK